MWLSDFYLWEHRKIHCVFSCLSCLGWFGFLVLWVGYWDLRPLFKMQSQTQSRDLAGCMPWQSMKKSTCSSEQIKPDKSTERLWKGKAVMQVTRGKDMEQKIPGGYGRWGTRQSLKDHTKHCTYLDLHNSWKGKPKISAARQKSAGEPSSATENLSRDSSLFPETSSCLLGTSKTTRGN